MKWGKKGRSNRGRHPTFTSASTHMSTHEHTQTKHTHMQTYTHAPNFTPTHTRMGRCWLTGLPCLPSFLSFFLSFLLSFFLSFFLSLSLSFFLSIYLFLFKFNDLFLFYVHWCFVCMCVFVRTTDILELELQPGAATWVLGIELRTSGRAVSALNHWAISPAPLPCLPITESGEPLSLPPVICRPGNLLGGTVPPSSGDLGQESSGISLRRKSADGKRASNTYTKATCPENVLRKHSAANNVCAQRLF